jgi:type I site-specific restriction endonuclease
VKFEKFYFGFRWSDKRSFSIFDFVKNYLLRNDARASVQGGKIDWRFKFLAEEKIRHNIGI